MTDFPTSNLSDLVTTLSPDDKVSLEKKTRREIANSNERRRMQSINTGFMRLKSLVPSISKEKVSKATILQQTAEHIEKLEREKKQLKRLIKLKDPNFNFEMEFVCENEEPEPIQNENSESSSLNAGSPVSAGIPAQMTGQLSNQAVIERTRQMILSAQLLSSLNALNSPIQSGISSSSFENDMKQNQLSNLLQAMIKNGQTSQGE